MTDDATQQDAAALAAHNAELRSQLEQENAQLEAALEATRTAAAGVAGLTDEDIRRLEHPEEFPASPTTAAPTTNADAGASTPGL